MTARLGPQTASRQSSSPLEPTHLQPDRPPEPRGEQLGPQRLEVHHLVGARQLVGERPHPDAADVRVHRRSRVLGDDLVQVEALRERLPEVQMHPEARVAHRRDQPRHLVRRDAKVAVKRGGDVLEPHYHARLLARRRHALEKGDGVVEAGFPIQVPDPALLRAPEDEDLGAAVPGRVDRLAQVPHHLQPSLFPELEEPVAAVRPQQSLERRDFDARRQPAAPHLMRRRLHRPDAEARESAHRGLPRILKGDGAEGEPVQGHGPKVAPQLRLDLPKVAPVTAFFVVR